MVSRLCFGGIMGALIGGVGYKWWQPPSDRPEQVFTLAELQTFTGKKSEDKRVLLCLLGTVFDVSVKGGQFYDPRSTYDLFAGHDITRSIGLASTEPEDLDQNLDGLTDLDFEDLIGVYYDTYIKKYPIAGKLALNDLLYDPGSIFEKHDKNDLTKTSKPHFARKGVCPMRKAKEAAEEMARKVLDALSDLIPFRLSYNSST